MHKNETRRQFLKSFAVSTAGIAAGSVGMTGCSAGLKSTPKIHGKRPVTVGESRVSLVKGTDRRQMIYDTLKPFEREIREGIAGKQVLIKINCNRPDVQLIKTHPDAVRGILDFITPMYDRQILVGESTALEVPSYETFNHYGFFELEKEYNVKIVELNDSTFTYHWILNRDMFPEQAGIIDTFLDPNVYIISVTPLKTHGSVVVTLSLKNVVMASPLKNPKRGYNFKSRMHGSGSKGSPSYPSSPKLINLNIYKIAHVARPDFAVLDGLVGAEGDGPNDCQPVDHKVALAGPDFLAVDRIGTELMGVPWEKIGYLHWCGAAGLGQGDLDKIKIIGPDPKDLVINYKLHKDVQWCYEWDKAINWELIHSRD